MNNDFKAGIIGGLVFLGILLCLGLVENTLESSSDKKASPYSRYSYTPNYGTSKRSSKKKNYYNSYDDGYDSIYDDGDYDDYRYDRDSDYADGVDDAMDELEW